MTRRPRVRVEIRSLVEAEPIDTVAPAEDEVVVSDPRTIKVLFDPLRFELVELLETARSVPELAEATGRPVTRLYYHVRLLERHGIVRAVERRLVGNTVETVYGLTAKRFRVTAVRAPAERAAPDALGRALRTVTSAIRAARRGEFGDDGADYSAVVAVQSLRLTAERAGDLARRVQALLEEFEDDGGPAARSYTAIAVVHPVQEGRSHGRR